MFLRRGENKNGMMRRFLQCLQKSVESRSRQHVHLIDNVYFVFPYLRRNTHLLHQLPDIVYRIVRSGIEFMDVVRPLLVEGYARFAFVTSLPFGGKIHTVYRFGEDPRASCFSYTARSAEQIGVRQFTG